ncbi:MAG: TrkA family potassium uptake protein [Chloroflexi bacterium]|nr:TrkA family potassium uptake protein [Chloroflexota bacterium]
MRHQVLVIGLGRFGQAVAHELSDLGHEVLAVDRDERIVNEMAPIVTHALELDATDELALRAAGAADFRYAVVAISSHLEASIFATMALRHLGVANIIAKAANPLHGEILERVGATRVVYPEREIGQRVAHMFSVPEVVDYLDVGPSFGIQKVRPPIRWIGRTLGDLDLPGRLKLTPIALRRGDDVTVNPGPGHIVEASDELILIGLDERLDRLGE